MTKKDLDHFRKYGWKCSETNLNTLPSTAPKEAKDLAKWLTLEGRRSSLEEWIGKTNLDTGCIHPKFWHIGAWTERMSHSSPNVANIPSTFEDSPITAVEEVKARYDGELRSLWHSGDGWLVGTDASSIQLRILAHYMKSEEYREAILSGKKEDETEIHFLNKKKLGPACKSRNASKTWIYAWLLGARTAMQASILDCTAAEAKRAEKSFLNALPELKKVREYEIPRDAARGFFYGLDGRKVPCTSTHLMLAGYLQNGEAVVMKHSNVLWRKRLDRRCIKYKQVNFVHDEWQTIVLGSREEAEEVGRIQRQSIVEVGKKFNLFCPLDGESKVGKNWKETH